MADSKDTRIAFAIPQSTTRRALVAGLALAPLAGAPAIAGAVADDDPVFAAIAECERLRDNTKSLERSACIVSDMVKRNKGHGRVSAYNHRRNVANVSERLAVLFGFSCDGGD